MTFDQAFVFHTVSEIGSIRAAAEALGRTRQAVSRTMHVIQNESGLALFKARPGRGGTVTLSDDGATLQRLLRKMFQVVPEINDSGFLITTTDFSRNGPPRKSTHPEEGQHA
jgi:DNA-binding transcriptional LysR family regulator